MPKNEKIDRAAEAAKTALDSAESWPFWLERGTDVLLEKIVCKPRGYDWLVIIHGRRGDEPLIVFYSADYIAVALLKFDRDARSNQVPWKVDSRRIEWLAQNGSDG